MLIFQKIAFTKLSQTLIAAPTTVHFQKKRQQQRRSLYTSQRLQVNPYKILNVKETATQCEVKRAYLKKVKETHPDINQHPGGHRFSEVVQAYQILGDECRRTQYDLFGSIV